MGVYVSDITMPKGDGSKLVLQIFPNGEVYDEHGIRLGITHWTEAVPVPAHGRLIDADALYKEALKRSETKDGYYNCLDPVISCYTIDRAPTIIPAEEGE